MQQDNEHDVSLCFVRCDDENITSKADELERQGKSRAYIKNELGVVRDIFGEWKNYLDINKCKLFANATAKTEGHTRKPGFRLDGYSWEGVLSDFIIWDEFFELFPEYENLRVVIRSIHSDYDKVRFNPKAKTIYMDKELCREYINGESKILKSYIMRELQRIIQYEEGRYIGYNIEHWQELERKGKLPFSEKLNRYLTAEDMMKYFEDNYETELMFKKQEFKHYVSQNRKYKSINDMMMYYPVVDAAEVIVYDDNGRLVTLKEKQNPKEKRRFSADKGGQVKLTAEAGHAEQEQSDRQVAYGNINEITEKGDNTLKLRSFVASKQKSYVKEQKVRSDYRIKGGNSGFVEKSGNDGEVLDEDYAFMLRSVFASVTTAEHDTVGRYIGINNQEMLEDSVCKNEKGEPISLYFMNLYGDNLSEQIKRGLALGTVDMAVAQYNEHRSNHKRIQSAVCTEVYAVIKRPLCLPFDPYDESYGEICDWLVNQDKITPAQYNRVVTMKSALKPYDYSNYATQALLDVLRQQGYDGIIYKNHRFAEGSKTVVPFYEHQLRPVAYDGILVQDDIIYDDAQDETESLSTVDAVENTENMKRYVIEPKYQNAKKRKLADERIKIGDAGYFENVETIDVQSAYEKINRELKNNSAKELSGYDTAGHRFSNMAMKRFDGNVFKDADGNILLFSMWNMNPLDIGRAADTGQEFVGFETALEEFFEHKISTQNSYHGVIEQFALNCVKPLVVRQNGWNTVKMAAELSEDGIISQQFYDNIMSLHSTGNGEYMSLA
ncbi:MAG: hypothetical protein IJY79_07990, partial [Clostridia bacterium]|nr:hypothetical protein [Clostridia bacterium]